MLTPVVLQQAQEQLDQGQTLREVAAQLQVKHDTLRKAVRAGRIHEAVKKENDFVSSSAVSVLSTKSQRQ